MSFLLQTRIGAKVNSFKFVIGDFEVTHQDGVLLIEQSETDEDNYSNYLGQIEIGMETLLKIHAEAERLLPLHNPSCNEVSAARTQLEYARDKRTVAAGNNGFEKALQAYMDISAKHKAAFDCQILH